jgi:RNA polymerase sigma factor (sigma-70 family)
MAAGQVNRIVHQLRWLAHGCAERARSDGQLLERFISRRDDAAFEELLRRHGPMVLGVCRRLVGHVQDAEDAFQATFMVLVRKARSVKPRELVGNWLYGVAYRVALEAQARSGRRRAHEKQVEDMPHPTTPPADLNHDLRPLLDLELSRLPEKYRVPIVLCDLEGRTRKDVARQLGVPEGTLSSRLNAGRKLLAGRLARHGLALTGAALASALAASPSEAAIPGALAVSTIKAAAAGAAGQAVALGPVSARAAALTEGVMKAMLISKLKAIAGALLVVGLFACGASVMTLTADEPQPGSDVAQTRQGIAAAAQPAADAGEEEVLRLRRQADGRIVVLDLAAQLPAPKEPAPPKPTQNRETVNKAIEWLAQHEARPKKDDLKWEDLLNKLHRYPHGSDFCASCHVAKQSATDRAIMDYLGVIERKWAEDGDIIVIRMPKKSSPSGDAQFLRRVCLDLLGRTPTALEMHYFLADKDAHKYRTVIDRLVHSTEAQPLAPIAVEPAKQPGPAVRAEAYVREKLGKQSLSPAERQIVERVVEYMQKPQSK